MPQADYGVFSPRIWLRAPRKVVAVAGSYLVTGAAAGLFNGIIMAADAGAYLVTGTDATLRKTWRLVADLGSYAITGTAASLEYGYRMSVDAGSYLVTGTDAALERGWAVAAEAGSYLVSGTAAALERGFRLAAEVGSYLVSGTAATLNRGKTLVAAAGSYLVSGTDANLERGLRVVAGAGSYAITGTAVSLLYNYLANAVHFDGTNDYLTRGADLTGVSDGKSGSLSFWVNMSGSSNGSNYTIIAGTATLGQDFYVVRASSNKIQIVAQRAGIAGGGTLDLILDSTTSVLAATGWVHILCSWDVAAGSVAQIYYNDVSDLAAGSTQNNQTLEYTSGNFAIGAESDGGVKLSGDLADVWLEFGTRIDFSVEANRRKFISAAGKPVYLGPNGELPLGSTPHVFLSGATANWHTNLGDGGGFTENGAITDAATSPSD